MQAPAPSQRSVQRRSPVADPSLIQSPRSDGVISPTATPTQRASGSSSRSAGQGSTSRRQNGTPTSSSNAGQPLSQIEKSVTHLLVATKQLLETLTKWSRGEATDTNVSDVYVRLGYEFNIACRAFSAIGVETADLGNVPELLRGILESTLSQEASPQSLDRYLPKIRDIIITLLHGLKRKQQKLRQKHSRDVSAAESSSVPRNSSTSSVGSGGTGITTLLNEGINEQHMPTDARIVDGKVVRDRPADISNVPPRGSSINTSPNRKGLPRDTSKESISSDQSTMSSTTMQQIPVLPPGYSEETAAPQQSRKMSPDVSVDNFPPPPPPPKQNALAALQRGGDLERRASRRYSQYHIAKMVGSQAPMPMLPQTTPVPNRGKDSRETMNAVRGRGSVHHKTQPSVSRVTTDSSPTRVPSRIDEESSESGRSASHHDPQLDSPHVKTPADKIRHDENRFDKVSEVEQPVKRSSTEPVPFTPDGQTERREPAPASASDSGSGMGYSASLARQFVPEQSPQPGKELTLFLQYKTKVKKFVLADGYTDLSVARLQLAFIEKFAWNTHNNGVDLPEIYIQDPISGVRHELEDLNDIKDRSVLVLNVEALDEVKRHIDEGLGGLKTMLQSVQTAVEDQKASLLRVSEKQQDTATELVKLSSLPARSQSVSSERTSSKAPSAKLKGPKIQNDELDQARRDLAIMRQTFSGFQAQMEGTMSSIRAKAATVKAASEQAAVPQLTGDSGRVYVNNGKQTLTDDSDKLVSRVDDLQDTIEDLRKDVVLRGVRPLPRQLENVARDISVASQELRKMQEFLKRERPIWTKIWEKELETVCNDREELTLQEDLAADLQDDLEKASQTFALVEQATKEQMKDAPPGAVGPGSLRAISRGLNHVGSVDPNQAKEGVLDEVRALQPNHESRLEAIERAEKLRQKELEGRKGGEFQKELGNFVEEGRLKKSGGVEEVERQRKARDERIRREVWERQNGMFQADQDLAPQSAPEPEPEQDGKAQEDGAVDEGETPKQE